MFATRFFSRALALAALAVGSAGLAACGGSMGNANSALPISGESVAYKADVSGPVHIRTLPNPLDALQAATAKPVTYHGGPIIPASVTYAIFWQPTGTFMSAKYQPVIEQFLQDVGNTPQYNILTQYTDTAGPILNQSSLGGAWVDTSPYPANFNRGGTGDTDLHNEVLKAIAANNWPKGGLQPVYIILTASKGPDDSWAACAYHSNFLHSGTQYIYAIVPYQHDYGAHGCGTPSNVWPNDRDADQTIDTMWHEIAESVSDPLGNAWLRNGSEIGDLCQTSYGPLASDGSDVTDHGHDYVTQEIWSNFGLQCVQTQASR